VNGAYASGATGTLGTPFNILGRVVADGNGNFLNDTAGAISPLTANLTGTYTVNADCTGTGRLVDQNNIGRNVSFVIGAASQTSAASQQVQFVFSDPGVFGFGVILPQ
jgi:hypothetical protein